MPVPEERGAHLTTGPRLADRRFDPLKEKRDKEAAERRKREAEKRKTYVARMTRKAKREDKDPEFYLKVGAVGAALRHAPGAHRLHAMPVTAAVHRAARNQPRAGPLDAA